MGKFGCRALIPCVKPKMAELFIGGVEGGATHSTLAISNGNGEVIATVEGPGTNHWMVGIKECAKRIAEMVREGKIVAGIPSEQKLKCVGLSLSGCEQEASNNKLKEELLTEHPSASESYVVCSDTVGSIATASPIGGLVLISGTGSNAFLKNPNGTTFNCGGWGHVMGDEGSAWWISHRAMKIVFDDEDNLEKCPYPTDKVWSLIKAHFSVETRLDLLDACYANFKKSFFAGLCKKLAQGAEEGDQLCQKVFRDAGHSLAKAVIALCPHVNEELVSSGALSVVCVGSVWISWDLLKDGFLKELERAEIPFGLNLKCLTQKMALGAVYLAADAIKYDLPRDYTKNYEIFHYYRHKGAVNGNNNNNNNKI